MSLKHYLALLGLCAAAPGCTPLKQVAEVVICEPAVYCLGMEDYITQCRDRHLAEEAWAHFQCAIPDCQYSDDFADGFKTGFADYIYAGGNGDPPVVPPRSYWKANYQSPQGQLMMQDWFKGYRHGTAVAKESGYRDAMVLPASAALPPIVEPTPPAVDRATPMPRADESAPQPLPEPKNLPVPKQLPMGSGAARPLGVLQPASATAGVPVAPRGIVPPTSAVMVPPTDIPMPPPPLPLPVDRLN